MNIGIVSPYLIIRRALCALSATEKDIHVVLDVDNALDSFEQIQKARPQILLIDTLSPGSELETVCGVRKLFPEMRILLLTDTVDEEFELRAIKAGAWGCVSKKADPQILEKALKVVANGEIWVRHNVATRIIGKVMQWQESEEGSSSKLTQREWEILALVAHGYRNKEIAGRLLISENTAKTHLGTIYRKLQVSTRLEAALHYFHQAKHDGNRPLALLPRAAAKPCLLPRAETRGPVGVKPQHSHTQH
jgi:DNA-binding NarL/FixJ family response regulator